MGSTSTTPHTIIPSGGEPGINPACVPTIEAAPRSCAAPASSHASAALVSPGGSCAANATAGQPFSSEQRGVLFALLVAALYMLTAVGYWGASLLVVSRRMRTEHECPTLRPLRGRARATSGALVLLGVLAWGSMLVWLFWGSV